MAKQKSKVGLIVGIIAGVILLIILSCAGCAWFGLSQANKQFEGAVNGNAVVREHVGTVEGVSIIDMFSNPENAGKSNEAITFDIEGSKGAGSLTCTFVQEDDSMTLGVGTLTMKNGTIYDLVTGATVTPESGTDPPGPEGK